MTLGDLLRETDARLNPRPGGRTPESAALLRPVTGIEHDSRRAGPGCVFVGLRGQRADGASFAGEAQARGAIAIVAESPPSPDVVTLPWVVVEDARRALAVLAAAFYRHPSDDLLVVGVTGTNGKTTATYLVSSIFDGAGIPCGRVGTVSYRIGDDEREATRTTPEAPEIQGLLREMVDRGCGACAMEVSSHALMLRRVDQVRFTAAVFTNLTRDHLDFHGDMEAYFQAKRRLFEMLPADGVAVVNADDPRGASLLNIVSRSVTYAIDRPADVTPGPLELTLEGVRFEARTPRGPVPVRSRLVGRPNVYNILAVVATCTACDLPLGAVEHGIAAVESVPGRFEVVSATGEDVTVVVDYAHTDDALKNLLETARPLAPGRLITVFGCGGDRDRTKRPLMGAVAARLSDLVIITSDNPRSEDPGAIIEDVRRGIAAPGGRSTARAVVCQSVVGRREAIEHAIGEARPGDMVLIAGKGHEKYQAIGDRLVPFDDGQVAREALARRRAGTRVS